jgi:tRNA nucleotidyltransferase (CCA-adding enzyme)
MHIILTHEQADFDALAALFGAAIVFSGAEPVLPRKMNRNVRAFITLYGVDFPFVDPRDLPPHTIEKVTLVDTQSLITLKGMNSRTKIQVIDHHPVRSDTPQKWEMIASNTGATTTYLVELLQEENEPLSAIQATLLLLGVYEDTGSLSYAATTPRDVKAAAWLLEQGASLKIASEFLNPPLSADQRESFDRLAASAETLDVSGHRIILASGEMLDANEEISTLAHKLRDLFDPDALFVLALTHEGVRLVARSTTDDIDVSRIAVKFKGGGHGRAAAALIRVQDGSEDLELLKKTRERLLEILPEYIRPSITVSQIMSRRPRVLSPDTTAEEASRLMQRYGYEGFPVVINGKVIGLLSRRAVDRALSHKLNLPAASLMDAGEISIGPQESLQQLQAVMTNSGWGQVPVVDPQNRKIIGIVTRTDLIKTFSAAPAISPRKNLSRKLIKDLKPDYLRLIEAVSAEAKLNHLPVYMVGGFVRDFLLGFSSSDFDIVVEGDAIALAKALAARHGGRLTTHSRFGTAKWFPASPLQEIGSEVPRVVDLISSRQEFYEHPTALPTIERGSIKLDLRRRDFTINTLAIRLDGHHFGELHDYFGGLADLEHKFIRVLHSLSFVDDPTRMLRAVRYEQRYGFAIEPRTLQLIVEARPLLQRLSSERLRHEIDLILEEPKAAIMLSRLDELGLREAITDAIPWNKSLHKTLDSAARVSIPEEWAIKPLSSGIPVSRSLGYLIWFSSLPPSAIDKIQSRIKLPVTIYKAIHLSRKLITDLPGMKKAKPSDWVTRLEDIPPLAVYAVYLISKEHALREYSLKWKSIHPFTDGNALRKKGLAPGPSYQMILSQLRAAWVDGLIQSREQETALLERLIKEMDS